jgi:3-hydroxyisobutyrate dehydrogenase-like beta-hydroxyacid dehydrogenase
VVKITTNLVTAAIVKALVEAAAITRSQGVELPCLLEAFKTNANYSPLIGMKLPAIIAQDFEAHFSLKNMLKDADFARALAAEAGVAAPVLEATALAMRQKLEEGRGDLDFSVIGEGLSQPKQNS